MAIHYETVLRSFVWLVVLITVSWWLSLASALLYIFVSILAPFSYWMERISITLLFAIQFPQYCMCRVVNVNYHQPRDQADISAAFSPNAAIVGVRQTSSIVPVHYRNSHHPNPTIPVLSKGALISAQKADMERRECRTDVAGGILNMSFDEYIASRRLNDLASNQSSPYSTLDTMNASSLKYCAEGGNNRLPNRPMHVAKVF